MILRPMTDRKLTSIGGTHCLEAPWQYVGLRREYLVGYSLDRFGVDIRLIIERPAGQTDPMICHYRPSADLPLIRLGRSEADKDLHLHKAGERKAYTYQKDFWTIAYTLHTDPETGNAVLQINRIDIGQTTVYGYLPKVALSVDSVTPGSRLSLN